MIFLLVFMSLLSLTVAVVTALRLTAGQFVLSPANIYLLLFIIFHFPLILMIEHSVIEFAMVVNLGLMGFVFGMYAAMHKANPTAIRRAQTTGPFVESPGHNAVALILFGMLVTILFYDGLPPSFDIFGNALQGKNIFNDLLAMSGFRADLTKSHYFGGSYTGQGALKLFNEMVWQLIVVFMFVRAAQLKTRTAWLQLSAIGVLAFLVVSGVGAKGPVAYIVIAALTARSFMINIPFTRLIKYTLFLFGFLILVQSMQVSRFMNSDENMFFAVTETLARRIAAGNGLNTSHIVNLISEGQLEYRYGYDHLTRFLNSLPGIQFDIPFAHDLFWMITVGKEVTKTTYATYTYLGGSFLDFGYLGAFAMSVVAGFVLQMIYRLMLTFQISTFSIAMSATFSIHLGQIVAGSLMSLLATSLVVAVLCGVVWVSNNLFGTRTRPTQRPILPPSVERNVA